jgi:hypothetical protein
MKKKLILFNYYIINRTGPSPVPCLLVAGGLHAERPSGGAAAQALLADGRLHPDVHTVIDHFYLFFP